jgi:peptidyl-dipeptidase Dcp
MPPTETENPLLKDWATPFEAPPFDEIEVEHFKPAFEQGMALHREEVAAISEASAEPSFDNTIAALERFRKFKAKSRRCWRAMPTTST